MSLLMNQLTKEIYQITIPTPFLVGPVNTYLIKGDVLTLVDTGPKTEEAFHAMKDQLKEINIEIEDIEVVILTHHHPDHIGLLEKFLPKAKVYGHKNLVPWLTRDANFLARTHQFFQSFYKKHGVPKQLIQDIEKANEYYRSFSAKGDVDHVLNEGEPIPGLSGWTTIETPGHAQSHISLLREEDGTLIAGDHLISHISSNAIIEAPYEDGSDRPKTLLQYRDALKKCIDVKVCYSGHGKIINEPRELIESRLIEQEKKAVYFKEMLGYDAMTSFELCKKVYHRLYEKQPGLTLSETLGHLDLLEVNGEVTTENRDGVFYYHICK
ncbi:MBL fold metallo-hydrolase [Bacillus shivajii]|uniref:MBL fold metallo-hydrolase n=1 Tax=Bacillus shivajii TaxID=1983719 RepID=UPI001CF93271|nr:MBL fold metallo-hydrolase [Bacillus shivajii]UCZ54058.1 MBL fold metallo-hydrolase [Bacillus shivajii]